VLNGTFETAKAAEPKGKGKGKAAKSAQPTSVPFAVEWKVDDDNGLSVVGH
jgi:hypothetical protein